MLRPLFSKLLVLLFLCRFCCAQGYTVSGLLFTTNRFTEKNVMTRANAFVVYKLDRQIRVRLYDTVDQTGPNASYFEFGYSGATNSYSFRKFPPSDQTNVANTASLYLNPHRIPDGMASPTMPVWLTFGGGAYYGKTGEGTVLSPCPPSPGFTERLRKLNARWTTANNDLLTSYSDMLDGNRYYLLNSQLRQKKIEGTPRIETNCIFRVTQTTNIGGIVIPVESELIAWGYPFNPLQNEIGVHTFKVKVSKADTGVPDDAFEHRFSEPTYIYEKRLLASNGEPIVYTYLATNEVLDTTIVRKTQRFQDLALNAENNTPRKIGTPTLILLAVLLALPLGYSIISKKLRERSGKA